MATTPLYSIGTYDWEKGRYTPQAGLSVPSLNISLPQLRQAMRELRAVGYDCHRIRGADGLHLDNDSSVLVERTDGMPWREILRGWDRTGRFTRRAVVNQGGQS